jgi:hypothetical protein
VRLVFDVDQSLERRRELLAIGDCVPKKIGGCSMVFAPMDAADACCTNRVRSSDAGEDGEPRGDSRHLDSVSFTEHEFGNLEICRS